MRGRILLLLAVVPFVLLAVFHSAWLPSLANFLILAEPPSRADAAIVLAGDIFGKRVLKAAELARENWVPVVYVSGPVPFYEQNEADLAIAMAVRHGHPRVAFDPVYLKADSTREEAGILLRRLRERNVRKFLIVTSDFHTRRTTRIFGQLTPTILPGAEFHVVAAPTADFVPARWWMSRPSQKLVFLEWQKTIAEWLRI